MTLLVSSLLSVVGRAAPRREPEHCLSCGHALDPDDPRIRLPGGGHVHRGCATYRMRQNDRIRRRLR
jgi:hypothetical protein